MKKQAESWLKSAFDDLVVIKEIINNDSLTHMVAFHAQQSIEKAIKSLLEEKGCEVPKIHNLIILEEHIKSFIELTYDQDIFDQLNELYIDSRYPTDSGFLPDGKPSITNAKHYLTLAENIYNTIKFYLSDN